MKDAIEMIVCPTDDRGNRRNSEGSVIELADGSLLLGYTRMRGGSSSDFAPSDIATRVSSDGGRSWSADRIVARGNDEEGNVLSASFVRLGSGAIALFYHRLSFQKGPGYTSGDMDDVSMVVHMQMMRVSEDGGATWSEERCISFPGEYCTMVLNDSAIRLSTGRIILPNLHSLSPYWQGGPCFVQLHLSDDDGKTWFRNRFRICVDVRLGISESSILERRDGSLLMMSRTHGGFIYRCESLDGGESWSTPVRTDLPASGTPTSLRYIPGSDDILLLWNQVTQEEIRWGLGRHRLTAAVSSDGGDTWPRRRNLESLDSRVFIPPEEGGDAKQVDRITREQRRPEMMKKLGMNPDGIIVAEYSSLVFVQDKAVITYDVSSWKHPGCSLKLCVLPKEWFHGEE